MAKPVTVLDIVKGSREYDLITEFYAGKSAKRSGRPYMAHIDEGLSFMAAKLMTVDSMKAFCLHPLFQADEDLLANYNLLKGVHYPSNPYVMMLVMEYRSIANAYLPHWHEFWEHWVPNAPDNIPFGIVLSPLPEVNDMLRADKVQNYTDFLRFHFGKHKNSNLLDGYFKTWLDRLDVSYRVVKVEDNASPYYLLEVK